MSAEYSDPLQSIDEWWWDVGFYTLSKSFLPYTFQLGHEKWCKHIGERFEKAIFPIPGNQFFCLGVKTH